MYDNTLKISSHILNKKYLSLYFLGHLDASQIKEIIYHIIDNDDSKIDRLILKMLKSTIDEGSFIQTEEEAINYLFKYINNTYNYTQSDEKKRAYVKDVILGRLS